MSRGGARGVVCRVAMLEGNLDAAVPLAEQWVAIARGTQAMLPGALGTLAVLRLACGERDEARRLAHEALASAEPNGHVLGKLYSELALARIHLSESTPAGCDEAAALLARVEQAIHITGFFARLPDLLELRAELARQRADAPGRGAALRELLRVYEEKGAAPHAERIARELAS